MKKRTEKQEGWHWTRPGVEKMESASKNFSDDFNSALLDIQKYTSEQSAVSKDDGPDLTREESGRP